MKTKVMFVTSLFWLTALALFSPTRALAQGGWKPEVAALQARVAALEVTVAALQAKLACVSVDDNPINGLAGPQFIFEGCNVHVRSGSGFTSDDHPATGDVEPLTGLGNLVVGYNEPRIIPRKGDDLTERTGSHNLIVGREHKYPSFGGFVAGRRNIISGDEASVSGGNRNTASGEVSSVSGGVGNTASGSASSVSGGQENTASGAFSSVSGGGLSNTASGNYSSVSGGTANTASGSQSSVSGGFQNTASGSASSVSGGSNRAAPGDVDWAAGTQFEDF